jgi:nicotinamidase-related amidase
MKPALLVIDMQNDFVRPGAPACVAGAQATVPVIKVILDQFRLRALPVFHVAREYRADGSDIEVTRWDEFWAKAKYCVPGTDGAEIVADLKPQPGEWRIVKQRFSAFFATELDLILRRLTISHLAICGTQYPNCIRATAYDAISYGYITTILTDATSADSPDVAEANIRDMRNAGIECVAFDEFLPRLN